MDKVPLSDPVASQRGRRNDNATTVTGVDPAAWIDSLPKPRQVEQGRAMLKDSGLAIIPADDLADAARKAVAALS